MSSLALVPVSPSAVGEPAYLALAARLCATSILSDPWIDGAPRFRVRPVVLDAATRASLERAAEELAAAFHALALACADDPRLVEPLALTPFQQLMWRSSAPRWHGLARADVFLTDEGPRICEINCDTPSGEAEAVLLNRAARADHPGLRDPNEGFEARFCDLVTALAAPLDRPAGPLTVGILYPTELTEDLSMIRLYRAFCAARGWRVEVGSPFNLSRAGGGAGLFGRRCDVFIRHYKTDWWGEREPACRDEPRFPDAAPLAEPLAILLEAEARGACAVLNPFGAALVQNKRFMALAWEQRARLPPSAREAIERTLPFSARLETLDPSRLAEERGSWVLKSDYGCEGTEVVIGAGCTDEEWRAALSSAIPTRFVAQRWFRARPERRSGVEQPAVAGLPEAGSDAPVNHGVYLVAGEACGFLSRVQDGVTDCHALTAPTFVRGES